MQTITQANISTIDGKELLAFYNSKADKPIDRFSSRKTAEKRVLALLGDADPIVADMAPWPFPKAADMAPWPFPKNPIPVGESAEEESEESEESEETAEEEAARIEAEASAERATHKDAAKPSKATGARRSNSAGVAASWLDPETRATRLTRDGTIVTVDGATSAHQSVRAAFRAYRLPDSAHIRFRLKLKSSRRETFEFNGTSYLFEMV